MARGRYYHDPARKNIEQYQDFSGGLNTISSNENLADHELTKLENIDLGDRGSLKRRKGYRSNYNINATGFPQGIFRFHRRREVYNLLGIDGSFDGYRRSSGTQYYLGNWYVFNLPNEADAYKVPRNKNNQLIVNGDFEEGEKGWDLNVDKKEVGDSLVGKSVNAYSGSNVMRIRSYKNHSGIINEYQSYDYEIPVTPGETIYAETMHRRAAVSIGAPPYRVHLIASVKKTDGTRERFYANDYTVNTSWRKISHNFKMPSDAVSVVFGVGIYDNDTSQDIAAYFDNIKAFRRSEDLAVNGDFEDGYDGWELDIEEEDGGDSFVGQSDYSLSGRNVLRIRRFAGYKGYFNEYQYREIPVNEGDRVEAKVNYRAAAKSIGEAPFRVHLIASFKMKDGTRQRVYENRYNTDDTWRELRHTFEVPKDAVSVRMGLGIIDNASTKNVAAYFDDFQVFKYEQLIYNHDLEKGEDGWELDMDTIKAGDSLVDKSVYAYSGENVLRIRRFKGHGGFYNEYQSWDTEIPTKAGEEFYAEAMYRAAARSIGYPPYRVHLIASVKKTDGTRERFYVNRYDCDDTWRKVSGYFKMPKNATSVVFGVGIIDNASNRDVAAYFDDFFVRKEIQGSEDSAVAIRSSNEDTKRNRGLGVAFSGIEPNKYYVYVVDFKADNTNLKGGLAIRDERFGQNQQPENLIGFTTFDGTTEWTTQFLKFRTGHHITEARAYVYNYSDLGVLGNVYYDNARIYEVTPEEYEKIGVDPDYSGAALAEKFPYRVGSLKSESVTETVTAIGGRFFVDGEERHVVDDIPIQTERTMEAVEYGDKLYIASGSGLLVYNGSTIAKVTPYIPDNLETLYIGSNALIDNPYTISDEEQSVVELKTIQFSRRYGMTNKDITLQVSVGKPSGLAVEYKFERRNVRDKEGYWFTLKDWSEDSFVTFKTNIAGEYQFKISVREKGKDVTLDEYEIPKYIIKPTEDESDNPIDGNTIDLCNRILVHWDRILLYGDPAKPDVLYISDLYNPAYFPVNNTLQFMNPRKERITSIVRYRGNLVVFTPTSIQALFGTNPENYERYMLNTDVGCIADRSAKVIQNNIAFLSYEGIALLKTVGTSETKANVTMLDKKIKNLVEYDENAVAYVRENQYHLVYPNSRKQLRYYYEWDVWTQDTSLTSLDFIDVIVEGNNIYALGSDGRIIQNADNYTDEGEVYKSYIGTKMFDFSEPYAVKKTKELQVMIDEAEQDTKISVDVFVDKAYTGEKIIVAEDFDRNITKNNELQYYVLEIKPHNPETLKKDFNYSSYDEGTPKETISNFAYRKGASIVLNASGLLQKGVQGLQVKDGVVYQIRNKEQRLYETAAIYNDGRLGIIEYSETDDPDLTDVRHTFHFGPYLIKDGVKRTEFPQFNDFEYIVEQKHPRQGIGQREDGTYVFITVDGRSDIAEGMTLYEFADLFEQYGCVNAYNLDGGGSAQTFVDGKPLNVYADGKERPVGDFIYFTKDEVTIVDGDRSGVIASQEIEINTDDEVYKINTPGKGITVGTLITHEDDKPLKLVGLGYIFKLKKP